MSGCIRSIAWRRAALGCLAAAVVALALSRPGGPASAADPAIADVRTGVHDSYTRFVIELTEPQPYRAFVLTGPNRVVIDLPDVAWTGPPPHEQRTVGLVGGLRYGLFRPGISRVVIDLSGPAKIRRHFRLEAGDGSGPRIVVDLTRAERDVAAAQDQVESPQWAGYAERLEKSSSATASLKSPASGDQRVIVLDPGHGGVDPGAIGVSGVYEKNVVLAMAETVKRVLEQRTEFEVVLTRDRDVYLPLRERYQTAHEVEGDLFISLHADAHNSGDLRGASVYTLSDEASDKEAAALARKENKADVIAGADLSGYTSEVSSILIDLAQQSVNENSWHFAEMLVDHMAREVNVLRNTHRFAGFAVLKSPNVPSVLIELGYLSNRNDERLLRSRNYRERVARALSAAIEKYFERQDRLSRS